MRAEIVIVNAAGLAGTLKFARRDWLFWTNVSLILPKGGIHRGIQLFNHIYNVACTSYIHELLARSKSAVFRSAVCFREFSDCKPLYSPGNSSSPLEVLDLSRPGSKPVPWRKRASPAQQRSAQQKATTHSPWRKLITQLYWRYGDSGEFWWSLFQIFCSSNRQNSGPLWASCFWPCCFLWSESRMYLGFQSVKCPPWSLDTSIILPE